MGPQPEGIGEEPSQVSLRTAAVLASLAAGVLLLLVTVAVLTAFFRIVALAEKSETVVVPQVLEQQQQAIMAAELGRVAEMILSSENRAERAKALDEAEAIAHRFAQIADVAVLSRLDSALHAVRRSAYRVDVLDALEESITGHLVRVDALLPPLGGAAGNATGRENSYSTQLLFEIRHVLYETATATNVNRLEHLRQRMTLLLTEMQTLSPNGEVADAGGRSFTVDQLKEFSVIFDLRTEYLKVREQVREETGGARRLLSELSDSLAADAASNASTSARTIVEVGWNGISIAAIAAALAMLVLGGLIIILVRHVVAPILRTHTALEAIHHGETVVGLPPAHLKEFDALGRSVHQLASALAQIKVNELAALRSREQLQFIFDASPVPFVMSTVESGEVAAANDAACALFGVDKDSFKGRLIRDFWVHPRRRDEMTSFLRREGSIDAFEAHMLTAAGAEFWAHVSARTVPLEGQLVILCAFVDVTEQRDNERRLQDLISELEVSNTELEQFAYVASHDLKEPLRVVSGYLQLLKTRHAEGMNDEGREFIGFAQDAARRMQAVITDLLDYARVGREAPSVGVVRMDEVIERARFALGEEERESKASVLVQTTLPNLYGDAGELERLFQNLIGNALKYRAEDRAPLVEISATAVNGGWEFAVADNGIGIAPEHTEKVFEIFQRLHGEEAYTGTGIGLAICRKIVAQHDGRLWVDTAHGAGGGDQGCTFRLFLPEGRTGGLEPETVRG
jgi:PAS domain S-box-containing protein